MVIMKRRELFAKALRDAETFRSKYGDDQAIVSIIKQLNYLIELEKGDRGTRNGGQETGTGKAPG